MVLPDFISAILTKVLVPLPRSAPSAHMPISYRRTSVSPHRSQVRRTEYLCSNFHRGYYYGVAVIPLCSGSFVRSTPRLLLPCGTKSTQQLGLLRHAAIMRLPNMNCGIATCPNWAIDTAGLPPAGLQPCRLLRTARTGQVSRSSINDHSFGS